MKRLLFVILVSSFLIQAKAVTAACPGDCNNDRVVTSDEVAQGIHLLFDDRAANCMAFDANGDRRFTASDLVSAVRSIGDCRTAPMSTATPSATATPTASPTPPLDEDLTLRAEAEKRGFLVGAAVQGRLLNEAAYSETLRREYNLVTTENDLKFSIVHPSPERYLFTNADAVVEFAKRQGLSVKGHVLVWHEQLPPWVDNERNPTELSRILEEHISTVVGRYRGSIRYWDVVNEAVDDSGHLRPSPWLWIGPAYIEQAFRLAHEADPEAILFYNDYGGEGMGRKSDAIYELLQSLVGRGVPVHGVGLQAHLTIGEPVSLWLDGIRANISRLSALGLVVHISEFDVKIPIPATDEDLVSQALIYYQVLAACLKQPECQAFISWGFTDRYSWVPMFFPGYGAALPFDENYNPKLAYIGLQLGFQFAK